MAWFNKKKQKTDMENKPALKTALQDGELIALLAAAVAACMETEPGRIVIRSYRKIKPAWRRSAREMQLFHHF